MNFPIFTYIFLQNYTIVSQPSALGLARIGPAGQALPGKRHMCVLPSNKKGRGWCFAYSEGQISGQDLRVVAECSHAAFVFDLAFFKHIRPVADPSGKIHVLLR